MSSRELERYAADVIEANENMLVPWILMAAYLYYCQDCNMVSDHTYDAWCRKARYRWRFLYHRHKKFITYNPEARTVMVMLDDKDYPGLCRHAALSLAKEYGLTKNKKR